MKIVLTGFSLYVNVHVLMYILPGERVEMLVYRNVGLARTFTTTNFQVSRLQLFCGPWVTMTRHLMV